MNSNLNDLAIAMGTMVPLIFIYYIGVAVRLGRDDSGRTANSRKAYLSLQIAGEALPGLFETMVTLAAVFGLAFQSTSPSHLFQHIGLVSSAAFLAFRGGYTYHESLLRANTRPAPTGKEHPGTSNLNL